MKTPLTLLTLALGLSSCSLFSGNKPVDVVVLGLNDFHGNLVPTGFSGIKLPAPTAANPAATANLAAGGAEIIGGYVLGYLGLATLQAATALAEVLLLFGLHYGAAVLALLFAVIWLLAVASVLLGIFLSTFARREGDVLPFVPLVVLPSVFLSGLIVDAARLPGWAQGIGRLFPLYYANRVIQSLIGPRASVGGEWPALLGLAAYSVALLLLASRTLTEVE